MKKLLLVFLLIGFNIYCQNDEKIIESNLICKKVDEFSDKVSYTTNNSLILYKDNGDMKNEGIFSMLFLKEEKEKNFTKYLIYEGFRY
jgi:hypothetical protein